MPRQFSPEDRETVRGVYEDKASVYDVRKCGDGLVIVYKARVSGSDANHTYGFTNLMEAAGWYAAQFESSDTGDKLIIMPVSEVPE
jgi:hypothetical protein